MRSRYNSLILIKDIRIYKRLNTLNCSDRSVFERIPAGFDNYFEGKFKRIFDKFGDSSDDILTRLVPIDPKTKYGKREFRLFGEYIKPGLKCSIVEPFLYLSHVNQNFQLLQSVPNRNESFLEVKILRYKNDYFPVPNWK